MNTENQKLVDTFLQGAKSVDIFSYALGVFVAHVMDKQEFRSEFNNFNSQNGIRFTFQILVNNMVAISEY